MAYRVPEPAGETPVELRKLRNARGDTIEVGFIVTVMDREHIYGTGEVLRIRGSGDHWFARVRWEDPRDTQPPEDWFGVDELTNINVARRDRGLTR